MLPMQKNFTLTKTNNENDSQASEPKQSSVNFIKQFARVCSMKKMSHSDLGVFILN